MAQVEKTWLNLSKLTIDFHHNDSRAVMTLLLRKDSGSVIGRRQQASGDQRGQGIFLGAEAAEQRVLFFRTQAGPDFDHFFGGADQRIGLIRSEFAHRGEYFLLNSEVF